MLGWVGRADPPDDRTSGLAEAVAAEAAVALDRGAAFARLAALAATDSLTGLPNRRAWEDGLGREMARAARERSSLTVAMVDLDNFKSLNDAAGHAVGDRMLKSIAACWRPMVRGADLLARYGGDEFGLALPECGPDAAAELIERLRQTSGSTSEFSCGLVLWDGREGRDALVARADQALYRAKAQGPGSLFFGG
jgi:diguanylate cyclase (GGDEF)-like protein